MVETYQTGVFLAQGRYTIILTPDRDRSSGKTSRVGTDDPKAASQNQADTKPESVIPERFFDANTSDLWVNLEKDSNWVEINL